MRLAGLEMSRRSRLRVKWIGWRDRARAALGICAHPATVGPAGGSQGSCLYCHQTVEWD